MGSAVAVRVTSVIFCEIPPWREPGILYADPLRWWTPCSFWSSQYYLQRREVWFLQRKEFPWEKFSSPATQGLLIDDGGSLLAFELVQNLLVSYLPLGECISYWSPLLARGPSNTELEQGRLSNWRRQMRKTKIFCVVLTVSRPPLHGRDLWCVQYKLLRSDIKDCCCFQTLKISSFKKKKQIKKNLLVYCKDGESRGSLEAGVGITRVLWFTLLMRAVGWCSQWTHHLLQRSLEPHGTQASCLVHGDHHQLGQTACLIPSTDGDCQLSKHELSLWQKQGQRISNLQRNAEDIKV